MDYIRGIKILAGALLLVLLTMAIGGWLPKQIAKLAESDNGGWIASIVRFFKGDGENLKEALVEAEPVGTPPVPQTPGGNRTQSVRDDAPWLNENYGD